MSLPVATIQTYVRSSRSGGHPGAGDRTEVKHLEDHPAARPVAPAASRSVLPATRDIGPSVGPAICPPLAELLDTVGQIDRLQSHTVELVARLQLSNEDIELTGIAAETWLAVEGRMTRTDRRMLATVAEHLEKLPLTAREFTNGGLSWSQVRTIVTMLVRQHRIRADEWHAVDAAIASAVGQADAADPDDVICLVEDWLYARHPETIEDAEAEASDGRYLAIQPRLDRTGGRFWGETDAAGLALLEGSTAPDASQLSDDEGLTAIGRVGRARHDNLMARLAASGGAAGVPPVTTLLTMDWDTLVGLSRSHAELLVSLTGGRLRVSAPTAQRLLADGFDARLIVLDETGQVLGVGRKTRHAPNWLRDALLLRDATCTHPLCRRAASTCQADHARPWSERGATDVDNLGMVCGPHNRAKEKTGWRVVGNPDGSRTWHHPRSGLKVRTTPTTRRLQPPAPLPPRSDDPTPATESFATPPAGADPPAPF